MKLFLSLALLMLVPLTSFAQSNNTSLTDVNSIENLSKAYYECLSGPIGQERDFDRFKNLFHPQAQFVYTYWPEGSTQAQTMIFDIDGYIEKLDYLDTVSYTHLTLPTIYSV